MAARTQNARPKADMPVEAPVSPAKEETAAPAKPGQPAKVRLDDSVLIRVKSNTYGQLIYVNKRTGDRTEWSRYGEEQSVTMGDLRAMKGTQLPFFSDQMIVVTGCDDERYPDLTPAEIYDALLVSRRLEGEFLAYRNAIPRNNTIKVEGDTRTLLASIDRVSLIISDKLKSPLRCVFGDGVLNITTKTAIGDAADQCPIDGDGTGLEIGFNNRYLMDALKAAPADRVRLELTTGVAPCVILPVEGEPENFLYMVLPVRLKAE